MKFSFHPSAVAELNDAVNYYEDCCSGLGFQFAQEVYSTIQRILQYSEAWPRLSANTRRCLTNRFPYGVIYRTIEKEILIIAIMQLNRKPDYWQERLA